MVRAARGQVVVVGSELVGASRPDLNGPVLTRALRSLGCEALSVHTVGDDGSEIARLVANARAADIDVVLLSGGLGPTSDDVTREGVAEGLERPLELDPEAMARIEARYAERGREIPDAARRQAYRPAGAELIPNACGTAPGFLVQSGRTTVVALPGVPRELASMLRRTVLPKLRALCGEPVEAVRGRVLVVGLCETDVESRVREALGERDTAVSTLAAGGEVELGWRSTAETAERAREAAEEIAERLRAALAEHVVDLELSVPSPGEADVEEAGGSRDALAASILRRMAARGWMLGTAESCTGGLVARRLTERPGASTCFRGAIVAYANEVKHGQLGVPEALLESYGAVSAEVALAMVRGVRARLDLDAAIAITGIAGPGGGAPDKPVGLVYIAVETPEASRVVRHVLTGDRASIRAWASALALDELRRAVDGVPAGGALCGLSGSLL